MKQMSIWQRLNTALVGVLVLLLMAGGFLAYRSEKTVTGAERRGDEMANKIDRIFLDEALMSDALRGLLLEEKSELEKKRRRDAESDLLTNLKLMETSFGHHVDL